MSTKPFTVTEWKFSGPGMFRGVGGIMTGAVVALPANARGYGDAGKDSDCSATRIWVEAEDFADFSDRFNFSHILRLSSREGF